MKVSGTELPGVRIIEVDYHGDGRGGFAELWRKDSYEEQGFGQAFVQDNLSYSRQGVLRGLHFQSPHPQAKLVSVLGGEIFDVVVDLHKGSKTYGKWFGISLSAKDHRQLFVPEGFAHGFQVRSSEALVHYKCTAFYDRSSEHTLLWNDETLDIRWPLSAPIISEKDQKGKTLRALEESVLAAMKR